jgi:hypothetical protein
MLFETLDIVIAVLGLTAMTITGYHTYKMWHFRKGIGQVLAWMLLGEFVGLAVALFFASSFLFHFWSQLPPHLFSTLRVIMFIAASVTTINLMRYLQSRIHRLEETYQDCAQPQNRRIDD